MERYAASVQYTSLPTFIWPSIRCDSKEEKCNEQRGSGNLNELITRRVIKAFLMTLMKFLPP